jgi:hypothetical protein
MPEMMLTPAVRELVPYIGQKIAKYDGLWQLWRQACRESFYFSLKTVLNQTPPEEDLMTWRTHGVIAKLCEHKISRVLHEEPRKVLKSSIVTVRRPWWLILCDAFDGKDLNKRYFTLSHGFNVSQKHFWDQTEIWDGETDGTRLFRFLFGDEIRKGEPWNTEIATVEREWDRKDKTFEPLAKKFAGKHCDYLTCDDLIDEENWDSPDAVEKAKSYLRASKNIVQGPESEIVVVGNRWGLEDVNSFVHRQAERGVPWTILSISASRGPRIDEPFGCVNLPKDVEELAWAQREFAEREGTIWPERFSRQYLSELREDLGSSIYSAQYENWPEDPENRDFDVDRIGEALLTRDEGGDIAYVLTGGRVGSERHVVGLSDCNVYVGWDPAADGKAAKSRNAIVAIATTSRRDVIVLKEYERKENPLLSVQKFVAFCRLFRGWLKGSAVEEVNFQRVFKDLIRETAREKAIAVMLKKVKTPTGKTKEQRMRANLSGVIESGRLFVAVVEDANRQRKCLVQKLRDGLGLVGVQGARLDLPDALSYAIQMAAYPQEGKARVEREEELSRVEMDIGITGYGPDWNWVG